MQTSKLPITGLIILGVLALFLVQNSSPTLSITFFGVTSIALPLGIWLMLPFLAGVMSAGFVALLLPRGDRPSRQSRASGTVESTRNRQRPSRQLRDDESDDPDFDESDVEVEDQVSPGKTSAPDERRRASSAAGQRRPPQLEEMESEVWDEEDWPEDEEWPDEAEENPSGVTVDQAVGNYEVHKEPVSAYRQGTLYSYSYSKSALEKVSEPKTSEPETSEPETSELETSEVNISEPETSEVNISEPSSLDSQQQNSPSNPDQVEGLDPSVQEKAEGEDIMATSDLITPSEDDHESEETLEGEFLDDSDDVEPEEKPSNFLRSKLFNFKDNKPKEDDWSEPPTPPKDW
ncbi:MAG: hypothetical protein ACLFM4_13315 [Phormidium sp.]